MIDIRKARSGLIIRSWILSGTVIFGISAFGWFIGTPRRVAVPLLNHLEAMSAPLRWAVLAPWVLILVLVIIRRSRSWGHFVISILVAGTLFLLSKVAGHELLNVILDVLADDRVAYSGAWRWGRYSSHLLADTQAWTLIIFLALAGRIYLERLELAMAIESTSARVHEAELQEELAAMQPQMLVGTLHHLAPMISEEPRQASRILVKLGDRLRALLAHLQAGNATVGEEAAVWRRISNLRDPLIVSVHEDADVEVPAGTVVSLLDRATTSCDSHGGCKANVGTEADELVIVLDHGDGQRVRLELRPRSLGADEARIVEEAQVLWRLTPMIIGAWFAGASVLIALSLALNVMTGPFDLAPDARRLMALRAFSGWALWGIMGGAACALYVKYRRGRPLSDALFLFSLLAVPTALDILSFSVRYGVPWGVAIEQTVLRWIFAVRAGFVIVGVVVLKLFTDSERAVDDQHHIARLRAEYGRARLRSLRAQLQPHFLLNTLHAINALVRVEPRKAKALAEEVAELVEETSGLVRKGLVPLQEEIMMSRRYLDVLAIRYGDRLSYRLEVEEGLDECLVPALISQPLLENALVHGVETSLETTNILMTVRGEGEEVILTISNPSRYSSSEGTGHGLRNTVQTLDFCYGDRYRFDARDRDGQYTVEITIPKHGPARGPEETAA